ncbi:uncharacterized protein YukE [Azospirillum fermentarium]|uniref:hypothetical protein n=1 Tax=Azospirillum fermentarium TaxID=1233114 RepID=UPI002225D3A5|nr:hypothetical protein [Azospirillum fermentarium]MCW2244420.1 uncharacterized protein YukE [Azospirillum fermentarium]
MPDFAEPYRAGLAEPDRIAAALTAIGGALGRVTGSADQTFLDIGGTLGRAVDVFGRLSATLAALGDQLHGDDAARAILSMEQAMQATTRLSEGDNRAAPLLLRLQELTQEAGKQLSGLQGVLGEVAALAINGKIQAVQVAARGLDFSVFTSEVGRLGQLAQQATGQVAIRLHTVNAGIASARTAAADFERNEAAELGSVRQRLTESLSALARRRQMAARAAETVATHSQQVSRRIAATVAELQVNDNVSQRLEHVRTALRTLCTPGAGDDALAAAAILLQARQLRGGAEDYRAEVEGLIRNLRALAADAAAIQAEAETAFSGSGGGLFMQDIARDIARAGQLLGAYAGARQRIQGVVDQVSQAFQAMAADLAKIRSIDADMRIMGLNATLKCGRLGTEGRALGVVAHELRANSKRTEECTQAIAAILARIMELSGELAAASEAEHAIERTIPLDVMTESADALTALGDSLSAALDTLRAETAAVAQGLGGTAGGITIHHQVASAALDAAARLETLVPADSAAVAGPAVRDELARRLQPLYTMERERAIHRALLGGDGLLTPPPAASPAAQAEDDIDSLFF